MDSKNLFEKTQNSQKESKTQKTQLKSLKNDLKKVSEKKESLLLQDDNLSEELSEQIEKSHLNVNFWNK